MQTDRRLCEQTPGVLIREAAAERGLGGGADRPGFPSDAHQLKLREVKNLASTSASLLAKDGQTMGEAPGPQGLDS